MPAVLAKLTEHERLALGLVAYLLFWVAVACVAAWLDRRERPPLRSRRYRWDAQLDDRVQHYYCRCAVPPVIALDAANPAPPELVAMIPVLHDEEPRDTLVEVDTLVDSVPAHELFSGPPPPLSFADEAEELSP